jgi:hypothetical protein
LDRVVPVGLEIAMTHVSVETVHAPNVGDTTLHRMDERFLKLRRVHSLKQQIRTLRSELEQLERELFGVPLEPSEQALERAARILDRMEE